METLTLNISGMTCMGCASSVERKLTEQPGVASAQVDLGAGQAEVRYDPQQTAPDILRQALRGAGWGVV
jgi:copper chaperone CopZ